MVVDPPAAIASVAVEIVLLGIAFCLGILGDTIRILIEQRRGYKHRKK